MCTFFPPPQSVLVQVQQERWLAEQDLQACRQLQLVDGPAAAQRSRICSGVAMSPIRLLQTRLRQQEDRYSVMMRGRGGGHRGAKMIVQWSPLIATHPPFGPKEIAFF